MHDVWAVIGAMAVLIGAFMIIMAVVAALENMGHRGGLRMIMTIGIDKIIEWLLGAFCSGFVLGCLLITWIRETK